MSRTFDTMKTNVGTDCQDTSNSMAAIIGRYLNKRYMTILRRINWNYIDEDYSISVTAGTQDYVLPTDYKTAVYAYDSTNDIKLKQVDMQDLIGAHESDLEDSGTVSAYTIFNSDDGSKYIRFFKTPASDITVKLPYVVKPTEMSDSSDTPVLDLEDLIEMGALADAWRYKRQFAKASTMEALFEKKLSYYIWEQENKQNQVKMFSPNVYDRGSLY